MPQMSPYNWMIMFMMFNFIMMILSSYTNFTKIPSPPQNFSLIKNKYIWKW